MNAAEAIAEELLAARRAHQKLEPLPEGLRPANEDAGIAVQHALAGRVGALPPAGFKIGATAKHMQAYLGLSGPAAGFMTKGGIHASGARLRFADFQSPGVECELAMRLAQDLPPGPCDAERAAAAVGAVSAGIEIVENRYPDLKEFGTPALIADQVFHAAAVVGAGETNWRKLDLKAIEGRILVNQAERGHGKGAELMGDPMAALAWLASSPLAARFGGLRAGQVVMLGSVTPPIWLLGPASVEVSFPPLPPVFLTLE
ncbi:MAG TPA: fumarylacetoacetate hydrolase family protein [Acetobacteraceae bacterium]|nr:fumarylacetoacetate hydrolase family protein [Acetobacteraceae bacterium]